MSLCKVPGVQGNQRYPCAPYTVGRSGCYMANKSRHSMPLHTALATRKAPLAYELSMPDCVLEDAIGTQPRAKET